MVRILGLLIGAWVFAWLSLGLLVLAHADDEDPMPTRTVCVHLLPGTVVRVIDGDTFVALVWVWPHQTWKGSVRLVGINAPEMHSKCQEEVDAAVKVKTALEEILPVGRPVLICNPKEDIYPGRVDALVLLSGGRIVSSMLLDQGVVRPYHGKKKRQPWCEEGQ